MSTTQTQNLEPIPSQSAMLEGDPKLITSTWMRWFNNLREKINVINASIVALSGISGAGFISSNGTGGFVTRTLVEGTNVTITNPDGVAGNPVINATGGGSSGYGTLNLSGGSIATSYDDSIDGGALPFRSADQYDAGTITV